MQSPVGIVKIRHILGSKEFADVLKNGKKTRGKIIFLYSKECAAEERLSVGVVISKRVVPQAVKRNYLRRLIYAYFRETEKVYKKGKQIVVRVMRNTQNMQRKSLGKAVKEELDILTKKQPLSND